MLLNDVYLYSTKLYFANAKPKNNILQRNHEVQLVNTLPINTKLETIILRDFKLAYGMNCESEFIGKLQNLKVFCVELNDLRGSDRNTFPKLIAEITRALSNLRNLECVEIS